MTDCDLDTSVPDWIIEHPETLAVFQALGIDCSCGGKSLAYACREQGLEAGKVLIQLHQRLQAVQTADAQSKGARFMAIPHTQPGEVIQLALGTSLGTSKTTTLVKTATLELIRLVLPAGKEIPSHTAPGGITVQCLEGRIAFTAAGQTQELAAGQLLYLAAGAPHALKGIVDSSVLVTILLPKT